MGKVKEYETYYIKPEFEGEYLNEIRNGKGKQYYYMDGNLQYKRDFLNGQFNGEGRKYYAIGIILFKREYLNRKKWNGIFYDRRHINKFILKNGEGNIREYDTLNGKLKFEVNILMEKEMEKEKEYSDEDMLKFEGEYLNGKGKEYSLGKVIFEGEYSNGKRKKGRE